MLRAEQLGKVRTSGGGDGPVGWKQSATDDKLDVGELAVGCGTPELVAAQPIDKTERVVLVQLL